MRKPIIAANWKMHKTQKETVEFLEALHKLPQDREVWIAPPFTALAIAEATRKRLAMPLFLGAQNVNEHASGAFTGEVSAAQLAEVGARFVILGHSERRQLYGETDAKIQNKIEQVVSQGMIPLLCVGETAEEREQGRTTAVLQKQLTQALGDFSLPFLSTLVIAYEPVWAIGTGKVATPEMANEAHGFIRKTVGLEVRILYGGSVNEETVSSLMSEREIDGVLVGGASLTPSTFEKMINY